MGTALHIKKLKTFEIPTWKSDQQKPCISPASVREPPRLTAGFDMSKIHGPVLDLLLTPAPPPGSRVALRNYLAPSPPHVRSCVERNVLPNGRAACCGCTEDIPPPSKRAIGGCGLTDGCAAQCGRPSRIPEGSVSALISIQVVWTHAAVPVM